MVFVVLASLQTLSRQVRVVVSQKQAPSLPPDSQGILLIYLEHKSYSTQLVPFEMHLVLNTLHMLLSIPDA